MNRFSLLFTGFLSCLLQLQAFSQKAPNKIPEGVAIQRDITFLESERAEKLDLYTPQPRQDDHPSFVSVSTTKPVKPTAGLTTSKIVKTPCAGCV